MNTEQAIKIYGKNAIDTIVADKPPRANAWHPVRGVCWFNDRYA